jgi:hypothetical protein
MSIIGAQDENSSHGVRDGLGQVLGAFGASHKLNRLGTKSELSLLSPQSLVPT